MEWCVEFFIPQKKNMSEIVNQVDTAGLGFNKLNDLFMISENTGYACGDDSLLYRLGINTSIELKGEKKSLFKVLWL